MERPRPSIINRIAVRLIKYPYLIRPVFIVRDILYTLAFRLRSNARKTLRSELESCASLNELYIFAKKVFDPHQNDKEIIGFLEFVEARSPRIACEIGSATGGTTFLFCHAIQSLSLMVGIDLYIRNASLLRYFVRSSLELKLLNAPSSAPKIIKEINRILNGDKFDVVFIDGDHSYDGVKADFLNYRQFVREGGIIAFHDIIQDYRTRFGIKTATYAGGVPILWNKVKGLYPHHEFVNNPKQDGLGIGAITYSSKVPLPGSL